MANSHYQPSWWNQIILTLITAAKETRVRRACKILVSGMAQWWERSLPTNVARVQFRPCVICGLSLLLVLALASRVFLRVLRFFSQHKNQHSKFQFHQDRGLTRKPGWCGLLSKYCNLIILVRVFQVLFRFALAVFKSCEEQLLKCPDHMSIFNFLRQMPEKVTDANTLSQVSPKIRMWILSTDSNVFL